MLPRVNLALLFQEFMMMFLLPKTGITPVKHGNGLGNENFKKWRKHT